MRWDVRRSTRTTSTNGGAIRFWKGFAGLEVQALGRPGNAQSVFHCDARKRRPSMTSNVRFHSVILPRLKLCNKEAPTAKQLWLKHRGQIGASPTATMTDF